MYKKAKDGEWEEAVRTKKTRVLVKGLKSRTQLHMLQDDGDDCVELNILSE